ncbi:hypothetical protein F2Q70_00023169 [Brassica cretica]|uniref:CRAL-TRIO domain-containing protein n=1 Tax=Brassica cretica TaxID=69181 RepID=A0A8S9GQS9_BRACR|nr:hypothetical protein F2Q70_00023169 [Brassica cretica]
MKLLKDSETKAGNGFVLVDMESSYLTVELFRKLHLEPKKEKPNPRNAPSQNVDIYSDNHFSTLISPFLTQRTKSKFVVTPPANVTETLLKEIPVQYGGNEKDDDTKFSNEADSPTKLFLKLSLTWVICKHRDPSF